MTSHPQRPRRTSQEQQRLDDALKLLFEQTITFNQVLGLKIVDCNPTAPALRFDMQPSFVGHYHYGRLHGGVISAVLDTAAALALMYGLGEKFDDETSDQIVARFLRMGTIDLRIDYLRPGLGKHFIATANVSRLGGRVGSTQMALHNDDGELIATGTGAYVVS